MNHTVKSIIFGLSIVLLFLLGALTGIMLTYGFIHVDITANGNVIVNEYNGCPAQQDNQTNNIYLMVPTYIYTNTSFYLYMCNLQANTNYTLQMSSEGQLVNFTINQNFEQYLIDLPQLQSLITLQNFSIVQFTLLSNQNIALSNAYSIAIELVNVSSLIH